MLCLTPKIFINVTLYPYEPPEPSGASGRPNRVYLLEPSTGVIHIFVS